jgi:hypothetical protein
MIIGLKSSFSNKYILLPLAIVLFYVNYQYYITNGFFVLNNLYYLIFALIIIIIAFEHKLFGNTRYLKATGNILFYKQLPFTKQAQININEISEINFKGTKIYIYSPIKTIVISLDFLTFKTRIQIKEYFVSNFSEKVKFTEQSNYFIDRYEKKLKKIEEKQKLKSNFK